MAATDGITSMQVSASGITITDLADGALAASAAGRLKMATGFFDAAAFLDKFAASSVDVSAGGGRITGALAVANGGTGGADAATARTNLGLAIGTNVQAFDATLTSLALLGTAADRMAYTTGVDTWAETPLTAAGRALIDDADAAAQRTTLGLVIGTNVQAYDATLLSLALLGTAADRYAYTTGVDTWAEGTITAAGRAILDDADAAAQRTTLALVPGTNVQAYDAGLLSLAALPTVADRIAYSTAADVWAETPLTAAGRAIIDDADAAAQRTTLGLVIGTDVQPYSDGHTADGVGGGAAGGGPLFICKLVIPNVPTGNQDFTLPAAFGNVQVIDAWAVKTNGAGGAGDTHTLQTGVGGAITDAFNTQIADEAVVRAGAIDDAAGQILAGGVLRVAVNDGGAADTSVDFYVMLIQRA